MSIRYYYFRDKTNIQEKIDYETRKPLGEYTRGNPFAVVITQVDKSNNTVQYAIAAAHKKDKFIKERGRKIAQGRLVQTPIDVAVDKINCFDITMAVMSDIIERVDEYAVPFRVISAAKAWLNNHKVE